MNVKKIQKRIDKGVKWLDKRFGRTKWMKKIDLVDLDLSSTYTCVIGEVMGSYSMILDEIDNPEQYGFDHGVSDGYNYSLLTKMWFIKLLNIGAKINKNYEN